MILSLVPFSDKAEASDSYKGTVNTYLLNVRENPTTSAKIVGKLKNNETVTVENVQKDWGKILFNGKPAYVSLNYIQPIKASSTPASIWVTPTVSVLNVRESASTYSKVIGKLTKGEVVQVVNKEGKWAVYVNNNKKHYVYLPYLTEAKKTTDIIEQASVLVEKGKVTAPSLNIRKEANTNSTIIGSYKQNELVSFTKENAKWLKVSFNKQTGYIFETYVEYPVKSETTTTIVKPVTQSTEKQVMTPTVDALNIRSEANTKATIIGTLTKKDSITVERKIGTWVQFTWKGKKGFAFSTYLKANSISTPLPVTPAPVPTEVKKSGTINATYLNVRAEPSVYSNVLGVMKAGNSITIASEKGDWIGFLYKGKNGFVNKKFITVQNTNPVVEKPKAEVEKPIQSVYGYVTASSLNARQQPSPTSKVVQVLGKNTKVELVNVEKNNWGKIKLNGNISYVSMSYISYKVPQIQEGPKVKWSYFVNTSTLNVRSASSVNSQVIGTVHQGDSLDAVKEVEDWLEIEFNGEKGFVSLAFVKKSQASETTTPKLSLAGKKIVLDAGHGGRDSGAIGHGLKEKDVVLDITHKLKSKLENAGATVILTRTNDTYYELSQRTSISNKSGADLFVSIHINASEHTSAAGTETFYYPGGDTRADNSYKLAQTVHEEMISQVGFGNRGIKKASFQVIRYNTLPSILVELGFVSNSYESSQLGRNEIREKFSNSMLVGIHNYFK